MVNAVANAAVPKFTVLIGASHGAGNYGMCGRAYSPRLLFTWPSSRISVMGGEQAAQTLLTVKLQQLEARGETLTPAAREASMAPILEKYETEGSPYYATARPAGADAVHPGYGFLAESAAFAAAVEAAGLVWIGPPPAAIATMGDKLAARATVARAGVPLVPGTALVAGDAAGARRQAAALGYPVLVKAAGGGGGKGMRTVASEDELTPALDAASRDAEAAFGDGR